jgi:hypothetical protein
MARKPSAKVPKTTGQGISRGAYQSTRNLRMKSSSTDAPKPLSIERSTPATGGGGVASNKREYPKGGSDPAYSEREMANPRLENLKGIAKLKNPKTTKGFVI